MEKDAQYLFDSEPQVLLTIAIL